MQENKVTSENQTCQWCKTDELPGHSPMYCVATLSSRVQELEEALRVVVDHLNSGVQWHPDDDGRVRGTITHAERALAGKKEGNNG